MKNYLTGTVIVVLVCGVLKHAVLGAGGESVLVNATNVSVQCPRTAPDCRAVFNVAGKVDTMRDRVTTLPLTCRVVSQYWRTLGTGAGYARVDDGAVSGAATVALKGYEGEGIANVRCTVSLR